MLGSGIPHPDDMGDPPSDLERALELGTVPDQEH